MSRRLAHLVVDLAYGDCGKGTIVDFLARRATAGDCTVIRFNGGPQAGHNVITPDRRHHTFSQFGSGSFVPGVRTFLSRFMLIEPYALLREAHHLEDVGVSDPLDRLTIDARCPVITPAHQAANRLRELARGAAAHGTCGMGVGETVQDTLEHPEVILRAGDLADRSKVREKLRAACELKLAQLRDPAAASLPQSGWSCHPDLTWIEAAADTYAELARHVAIVDERDACRVIRESSNLIFEGAQGVLLDENYGFHPHTTWSTTTFANAETLLNESGHDGPRMRLGVLRSYFTRHGAGPFVTEDPALAASLPEPHNTAAGWQGNFRVGVFDAVAARYALAVCGGVDALAVTHLDRVGVLPEHLCTAYESRDGVVDDGLFVTRNERATDIRYHASIDLARQERLGEALGRRKPVMSPLAGQSTDVLLHQFRALLGVPISVASHGPTAADKHVLDEAML